MASVTPSEQKSGYKIDIGSKEGSPRCRFLYDHLQSLEVVILRFRKISSKQAVQNAIFCRIK